MALSTTDLDNGETDLETLSTVVNSTTETETTTRLGDTVKTRKGLTDELEATIESAESQTTTLVSETSDTLDALVASTEESLDDIEDDANDRVDSIVDNITYAVGWNIAGDFADLATVTNNNDVLTSKSVTDLEDAVWRYIGGDLPYTPTGTDPTGTEESGNWEAVAIGGLISIARARNCLDSEVIYATDTTTVLNPASGTQVLYIYDANAQVTYGVPTLTTTGETIISVSGSELVTNIGLYTLSVYSMQYNISTVSDIVNLPPIVGLKVCWFGYYVPFDIGGNTGVIRYGAHTEDGGSIFTISGDFYVEAAIDHSHIKCEHFGVRGGGIIGGIDDRSSIQAALDAAQGTVDVYNAAGAAGAAGSTVVLGAGEFIVNSRLLVVKNGTRFVGAGRSNTTIKATNTGIINEILRFRSCHYCELEDMTLDGGLPYIPTRTETYGATAGLTLDLTPRFNSKNVQIKNTRQTGLLAIHMWEALHIGLWCVSLGYFADNSSDTTTGACVLFSADASLKESGDELGSGYESMNSTFIKPQLAAPCSLVWCQAPTNDIKMYDPYCEAQVQSELFPALTDMKYRIASSNGFKVFNGYYYGQAQPFSVNATLIGVDSSKGTAFKDFTFVVSDSWGNSNPITTTLIACSSQTSVNMDGLTILDDVDLLDAATFNIYGGGSYSGKVIGNIEIVTGATRTYDEFFSGTGGSGWFDGKITMSSLDDYSSITLDHSVDRALLSCVAKIDTSLSTANVVKSLGFSSIVRSSAGVYRFTFNETRYLLDYVVTPSVTVLDTANDYTVGITTETSDGFTLTYRSSVTPFSYSDPLSVNVIVS